MTSTGLHAVSLRRRSITAVIFAVLLALLGGNVNADAMPRLAPVLTQSFEDDTPPEDEEYVFYRELVQRVAEYAEDVEVREAAVLTLAENSLEKLLWFLDYGNIEARAKAAERKRAAGVHNRELVTGWAQTGGPNVRARAQEALNSNDDASLADFVDWGKEIAETQDNREAADSAAEKDRVTGRVRDMVAHGGPQVKVEGEAILINGDYARIRTFYLTGYAEANKRDHDFQRMIEKALEDRNRAATELDTLARLSQNAANARAEILRANITAIKYLDDASFAMRMGTKAAHRADEILREDKPGRAHGQRGRDQELDALRADATRYAEQASRAAGNAAGTTAQVQNAAVRLIDTGMTNGLDWAKVTIAVGAATEAAALAATTTQHATEATLADSRALDANANAQEHADNARKYREEAERQAVTAEGLAEAAKKQQDIAIGARDRAAQEKTTAENASASARTHAANARNARLSAESASSNAVTRAQGAVTAHGDAVKAGIREQAAADAVQRSSGELQTATTVCNGKTTTAEQFETALKQAREKAIREGQNADEATKDIAAAAGTARSEANEAAGWAGRAQTAAATARSEATSATAAANQARAAAARADQEAVTARRAADEANRLAIDATNVAISSREAADHARFEAEASVSEANQAVFQSVIADRAASAAGAAAAMIIDPAGAVAVIARPYAAINEDARKALAVSAQAIVIGEEQANSAREKAREAKQASDSAQEAANRAVDEVKPAFEAAARAASAANLAAQYALGANDAANTAQGYAQGAHNAAATAAQYASSARSDANSAGNAAAVASSAAQSAGEAAAASELILDWAKQATAAIHGYNTEVGNALDQFTDAKKRAEEAQKKIEQDAQRKQDELNGQFWKGAEAVTSCAISLLMPQCVDLQKKYAELWIKGLQGAGDYVSKGIQCRAGNQAACRAYEDATKKLGEFTKQAIDGFTEGAKSTWDGIVKLGECVLQSNMHQTTTACNEIRAGLENVVQNPYQLVHLDVWHDNPGKAFGLTAFDVLAAAVTTPLGGSGSALSKALDIVSLTVKQATTKISGGLGRISHFTMRIADSVTGRLPGSVADITGLTVRVENGIAKLDGALAGIEGRLYQVESLTLRVDGDLAKLEGSIAKLEGGTLRLENGVAKIENAEFRFEPVDRVDPPTTPNRVSGRELDDGSWVATEFGQEIRLTKLANDKTDAFLDRAEIAEKDITPKVRQVIDATPGGKAEGLNFSRKGEDSLKLKVAAALIKEPNVDVVLSEINDGVRYTMTLPEASYTAGVQKSRERLAAMGFEEVELKNFWQRNAFNNRYRGINTTWRDPKSSQLFEFQIHTDASFAAKQFEHPWYELQRTPSKHPLEVEFAKEQAKLIFGEVRFPIGAVMIDEFPVPR